MREGRVGASPLKRSWLRPRATLETACRNGGARLMKEPEFRRSTVMPRPAARTDHAAPQSASIQALAALLPARPDWDRGSTLERRNPAPSPAKVRRMTGRAARLDPTPPPLQGEDPTG